MRVQLTSSGIALSLAEVRVLVPGSAIKQYYYAGGQRIAERVLSGAGSSVLYYLHGDHLGSTSATTCGTGCGTAGALLAKQLYYPFGQLRYGTGTLPTDYGYTGQRLDDTGWMFYNARYYDPALARFTSADTIVPGAGNPQNLNRYSYATNNPTRFVDPDGHDVCDPAASEGTPGACPQMTGGTAFQQRASIVSSASQAAQDGGDALTTNQATVQGAAEEISTVSTNNVFKITDQGYGKNTPATQGSLGERLALAVKSVFSGLLDNDKRFTTVAQGSLDNGELTPLVINGGAPRGLEDRFGQDVVRAPGKLHPEQYLMNEYGPSLTTIGVSHYRGPCADACYPMFAAAQFFEVYFQGWIK